MREGVNEVALSLRPGAEALGQAIPCLSDEGDGIIDLLVGALELNTLSVEGGEDYGIGNKSERILNDLLHIYNRSSNGNWSLLLSGTTLLLTSSGEGGVLGE